MTFKKNAAAVLLMMTVLPCFLPQVSRAEDGPGATRVATWKDDKKAAFLLMFDDSCRSHEQNVIPALEKKGMAGTFYNNPGSGQWKAAQSFWETKAPGIPGIVYANHTMTHKGFTSIENAEQELVQSNETIYKLFPGKQPRLISYAEPGGVKNAITPEEVKELLAKYQLVLRPTFGGHGAGIAFKTADEILKMVDRAIAGAGLEYVIFHGVGGDWITFDLQQFNLLLDGLEARKADVWITDHISAHQYQTEREGTTVGVSEANETRIVLEPKSSLDPALYDLPLTLITRVPTPWTECVVKQKDRESKVAAVNGEIRYEAIPGDGAITILAVSK